MNYDVIGDIHGHCDRLVGLLRMLGYQERMGAWRHATRQVIFVGDFIDRGPRQLETLNTVRRMVDAGSAIALMGNHEFNAIAWYTEDPLRPGRHLRPRDGDVGSKNRNQHHAFLSEIEHRPLEHQDVVGWFYTLPLWIDLPGLRVVHACWHPERMRLVQPKLGDGNRLTPELMISASRRGTPDYVSVETILKGLEVPLPGGQMFRDKDGHSREAVRIRWWDPGAITYRQAAITGGKDYDWLPDDPIPEAARLGYVDEKPVLFGHYWMTGRPAVQTPVAACVDYSAGNGGALVAYRWEGERELDSSRFVDY